MNSASRSFTVRIRKDSLDDHVSAFRTALELFGKAELSSFVPSIDHPQYLEIVCELVRLELVENWLRQKPVPLETYREEYAALFAQPNLVYKLALEEYHLRREAGENPSLTEYCERFKLNRDDWPTFRGMRGLLQEAASSGDVIHGDGDSVAKTKPGNPANKGPAKQPSEPEIILQLHEAMTQMPSAGGDFCGFHLLSELGKGAFGKVFLARQGQLAGRLVALKVASDLFVESQTLAQLQHTHIVPIYSFHPGQPFQAVCMPYLGSTTLAHILENIRRANSLPSSGRDFLSTLYDRRKKSTQHKTSRDSEDSSQGSAPGAPVAVSGGQAELVPPAPPARVAPSPLLELEGMSYVDAILWLVVRLADGLAHAHERGVYHRDLKPANVLLTDEGLPMLVDFNLAENTRLRGSAAAASVGGTLPYMAPEHLEAFRGNAMPVDARSDLYSLGVILFELLTGAAPFPTYRKIPMKEIVRHMIQDRQGGSPGLRCLNKAIPPAVEAIVQHCLAAAPGDRYQSVRQLQEDVQRQLEHRPLRYAGNPSLWERAGKFRRRHPRLTSAGSVAGFAFVILSALAALFVVRDQQRANLEARATLTRFDDDVQTAYFLLNARTARQHLPEGEHACRATLEHFQVLENPDWREASGYRRLPVAERQRLEEEVGQLLVLLAHARQLAGETEEQPEQREKMFRAGLQLCSLAKSCFLAERLPRVLWMQEGDLHQRLNEGGLALDCFERAKTADLRTARDRYLTAQLLAEEGNWRGALPLLREAIRLSPQDFHLHFLLGICRDALAHHAEAVASWNACVALRPRFWGGYYNRGLSRLRQSEFSAACEDFDEAVRLNPDFAEIYLNRALALQGLEKYAAAEADFTVAIDRKIPQTRVYFLRARLREQAGNPQGAKTDFAEGLRREPSDEISWISRGLGVLATDPKQALSDFNKAIKLNPRSLAGLQNKAHVLAKYFKRTGEAIATLDNAVRLYPHDPCLRAGRGVYLARLGKRDAAHEDAQKALALDAGANNLYHVAGIYALTSAEAPDDRGEALRLLSSALKKGFGFEYLAIDRDLDPIRATPAFRRVIEAARALEAIPKLR